MAKLNQGVFCVCPAPVSYDSCVCACARVRQAVFLTEACAGTCVFLRDLLCLQATFTFSAAFYSMDIHVYHPHPYMHTCRPSSSTTMRKSSASYPPKP